MQCGVCGGTGIPAGDCDCDGNQNDALGICGGPCEADVDADGICDDAITADVSTCNYDDSANSLVRSMTNAVCGGAGIPAGDCDCNSAQNVPWVSAVAHASDIVRTASAMMQITALT